MKDVIRLTAIASIIGAFILIQVFMPQSFAESKVTTCTNGECSTSTAENGLIINDGEKTRIIEEDDNATLFGKTIIVNRNLDRD